MKTDKQTIEVYEDFTKSELAKFNLADETINKMKEQYMPLKVTDCNDMTGFEQVKQAKQVVSKARIEIEKKRKEIKESYLKTGKAIDGEAKRLTALIEPIETHLQREYDIVARENERREQERQRAIKEKHDERVEILVSMGMTFNPIESKFRLNDLFITDQMLNIMEQESFDQFATQVQRESEIIAMKQAESERLAKEEQDRQAKIQAKQEAERIRLQKIADEQARQQAELKKQQDEIDNQKRKIEQDKAIEEAKKQAVKQAEIDRIANEKRLAEQKAEQEKQAKIEAERQEALKPDKKKLLEFAETIKNIPLPELKDKESVRIAKGVKDLLTKVEIYIKNQTAEMK